MMFGDHTYAQHGDDIILLALFDSIGIEKPSYLDIGAGQPFSCSNTALLYERGSRGINVDADPDRVAALRDGRPDDVSIHFAVGVKNEKRTFYRVEGNRDLSSLVKSMAERHGEYTTLEVEVRTIGDIIKHIGGDFPDLLSIDIEGLDYDVLEYSIYNMPIPKGNVLDRGMPKVICVETICCGEDRTRAFVDLLRSRGYVFCFRAGANSMFLRVDLHRYQGEL